MMIEEVNTKRCTKCGEVKSLEQFYWRKTELRFSSWCKFCENLQRCQSLSQERKKNPEKARETWHRYRIRHLQEMRIHDAERQKLYRRRFPEKARLLARQSRLRRVNDPERCAVFKTKRAQYYLSQDKEALAKNAKIQRAFLMDGYIKVCIRRKYHCETNNITPEMVALEREHISLMRLIRQKKKEVA